MTDSSTRARRAIVLVAAALAVAAGLSVCLSTPGVRQAEPTASSTPVRTTPDSIARVSLTEAKEAFDSRQAVFLDVRAESSYEVSHIPGALSIPLGELEQRLGEMDPESWIITYCT